MNIKRKDIDMAKFKVGDKVRVKSLEWYNENKDDSGAIMSVDGIHYGGVAFIEGMREYCGKVLTIDSVYKLTYAVKEDNNRWRWAEFMFEDGIVKDETPTELKQTAIDLTEILKGCEGTKLYSPVFGECKLRTINEGLTFPIDVECRNANFEFTKEGKYAIYDDAEILLFPSKDQRDWSKFKRPRPDLPVDTPCMIQASFDAWSLRFYAGNGLCFQDGKKCKDNVGAVKWGYIIPVDKFNFDDLESNKKSEWNYGTGE